MSNLHPCDDCNLSTCDLGEWYMVWKGLWPEGASFLCIGCLEDRLGRELELGLCRSRRVMFRCLAG